MKAENPYITLLESYPMTSGIEPATFGLVAQCPTSEERTLKKEIAGFCETF
jgi:hypothetical protein